MASELKPQGLLGQMYDVPRPSLMPKGRTRSEDAGVGERQAGEVRLSQC